MLNRTNKIEEALERAAMELAKAQDALDLGRRYTGDAIITGITSQRHVTSLHLCLGYLILAFQQLRQESVQERIIPLDYDVGTLLK